MRAYPLGSLLLAGCAFGLQPNTPEGLLAFASTDTAGGDTDTDTDTDTDADTPDPEIISVDPAWDTTLGGAEVALIGTFGEDAAVRVGGSEAEIKTVQPIHGKLVFYAPEATAEGTVNVVLESGGKTAKLVDGFTYYQDGTGLPGLLGTVAWIDMVGTYWSGAPNDSGYAWLLPVVPGEFDWPSVYAAAPDTCASDQSYAYDPLLTFYDPGAGSSAAFDVNGKTVNLPWDVTNQEFLNSALNASQFVAGAEYDLSALTLSQPVFPEYTVAGAVQTPASFTVTAPAIGGSTAPGVSKNFTLTWGGAAGDGILVTLALMNKAGSAVQETVTCQLRDDGSFNIPSNAWQTTWPSQAQQVNIYVSRYKLAHGTIPYNNAETAILGEYVVYGAAFTK